MIAYRLAVICGCVDVDGMLDSMTPEQFDEWVAYYTLEPFDFESLRSAIANSASAVCHAFGAKIAPWDILGRPEPVRPTVPPSQASAMFGRGSNGRTG